MVVPAGWQLDAAGVSRVVDGKSTQVISTPVVISRRFQNLDHTDIESLEIAWLRDGHWKSKVVTRATVAGTREIIGLADAGLPVTATNAGQLIDYLADFEATNICILSIAHQVARMGWISIGSTSGFMLGKSFLSASPTPQTVLFIGDPGQEQIAAGFHSAGTFEGWRMAVTPLANYPRVQLAFYAGLAAPLLEILDAPNFIFSMAGATSQGKTTALRVVASACGRPDERSTVAAMHTWDLSRTYLERAAAAQSGLPLCVDDTKRVGKTEWVSQILYDIASGRGRGRGSVTGLRESSTWRTVLLTTGEESILSFSQDGGTHARVVQFWGSPFGLGDAGAVVESINRGIVENYGHAGAEFVRQLLLTDHNSIRATYRQRCEHWRQFTDNPVGRRIAGYVAAIEGAEWLAHQFNIVPWPYRNVVTELWTELICQSPDADRPAAAMRYLIEYCVAHKNEFQTRRGSNDAPHGGWLGRWEVTPHNSTDRCLAIFTHRVDKILRDGGYEPDATRRHWRDRGWLLTSENRPTYKVRIDGTTADMVAIRWAAIRDLVGEADIDADGLTTPAPGQRLLHLPGDQGQAAS
jgi:hypothetical protein